eukprot:SAG31_NODE_734_length_12489_cov_6.922034_5_plen_156_part_00
MAVGGRCAAVLLLAALDLSGGADARRAASGVQRRRNVLFFAVDGIGRAPPGTLRALSCTDLCAASQCFFSSQTTCAPGVQTSGRSSMLSTRTSPSRAPPMPRCTHQTSMPWRASRWCFARIIVSKQYVAPPEPRCSRRAGQTARECGTCPVTGAL